MLDHCELVEHWQLTHLLASRLIAMQCYFEDATGRDLVIISGHRTCQEQKELKYQGRPAAPCELSTHVIYPAQGADLRVPGVFPSTYIKQHFGAAATLAGLRWGGGSPQDERGIPSDWNHVDTGPRTDPVATAYRSDRARQAQG